MAVRLSPTTTLWTFCFEPLDRPPIHAAPVNRVLLATLVSLVEMETMADLVKTEVKVVQASTPTSTMSFCRSHPSVPASPIQAPEELLVNADPMDQRVTMERQEEMAAQDPQDHLDQAGHLDAQGNLEHKDDLELLVLCDQLLPRRLDDLEKLAAPDLKGHLADQETRVKMAAQGTQANKEVAVRKVNRDAQETTADLERPDALDQEALATIVHLLVSLLDTRRRTSEYRHQFHQLSLFFIAASSRRFTETINVFVLSVLLYFSKTNKH